MFVCSHVPIKSELLMCMEVSLLVIGSPEVGNTLGLIDILSQVALPQEYPLVLEPPLK